MQMDDDHTYYLFFGASVMLLVHTILTSERSNAVIIIAVLAIVVYKGYEFHIDSKKDKSSVVKYVEGLSTKTKQYDDLEGELPTTHKYSVANAFISSDRTLHDTLLKLKKYKEIDIESHDNTIRLLMKFYELYANILSGKKEIRKNIVVLVDTRRSILNSVSTLYVQLEHTKHGNNINRIITSLQAATWKCMNVLKNKYGIIDYVAPIASNMAGTENELF